VIETGSTFRNAAISVQAVIDATFELEGATKPACVAEILIREYV
jgi:hypothetical protein